MTRVRRAPLLAASFLPAFLVAAPLAAQVALNRTAAYLHPSDVHDARAIWVNPAGLGVVYEASVTLDVTVGEPGPAGRLRQVSAGFNSRGLAFGYQRDEFDSGVRGHTYRVAFGAGAGALAAGAAVAHYRGGTSATGWDVGLTYTAGPRLRVAGVVTDIGQPVVRGLQRRATLVPGVTVRPLAALAVSAHGRLTLDSVVSYGFGIRAELPLRVPLGLVARLDTDGELRRGAFVLGLTVGGLDRLGVVLTTPGDVSAIEAASLHGVASRPIER